MKPTKAAKPAKPVQVAAEDEEPVAILAKSPEVVEEEEEETEKTPPPVTIRKQKTAEETVRFNLNCVIDPSPRIGHFSFAHDMNLTRLDPGVYEIPRFVAEVLLDAKKGQIIS